MIFIQIYQTTISIYVGVMVIILPNLYIYTDHANLIYNLKVSFNDLQLPHFLQVRTCKVISMLSKERRSLEFFRKYEINNVKSISLNDVMSRQEKNDQILGLKEPLQTSTFSVT